MRTSGLPHRRAYVPPWMPTEKPRKDLLFAEEDLHDLEALWLELRSPQRRGDPSYIGRKVTFNQWLASMAMRGAAEVRRESGAPKVRRPARTAPPQPEGRKR